VFWDQRGESHPFHFLLVELMPFYLNLVPIAMPNVRMSIITLTFSAALHTIEYVANSFIPALFFKTFRLFLFFHEQEDFS